MMLNQKNEQFLIKKKPKKSKKFSTVTRIRAADTPKKRFEKEGPPYKCRGDQMPHTRKMSHTRKSAEAHREGQTKTLKLHKNIFFNIIIKMYPSKIRLFCRYTKKIFIIFYESNAISISYGSFSSLNSFYFENPPARSYSITGRKIEN